MLGWELPPHNSGGLGVACFNLSKALAKEGAQIDFIVPYSTKTQEIDFMNVVSALKIKPLLRYGISTYHSNRIEDEIFLNGQKTISIREIQYQYQDFVKKYLMQFKPEVVHAHDWLTFEAGILAKKNYGLPLVAHVHATEYDRSGMNGGNQLVHEIEREGLMLADKIIAVSKATKRIIHEKYQIPNDKITVMYNSLDERFVESDYESQTDQYQYIKEMKKRGWTIVLTVGRFTIQKGLSHMMRAAARAISKEAKLLFVFAGDGEERDELVQLAAELRISKNVIFTGFIRGQRLRNIYEVADIFVMSSVSEPFGLTALEAAHHNNILILTKQSGVAEVLNSVMEYDFWDEKKLADEIVAISKSEALRKVLHEGIEHEYRRISWGDIAKKCLKTYDEVRKHKKNNF